MSIAPKVVQESFKKLCRDGPCRTVCMALTSLLSCFVERPHESLQACFNPPLAIEGCRT